MRRARSAVEEAHLAIFVVDTAYAGGATALLRQLREEAAAAAEEAAATAAERDDADDGRGGVWTLARKALGGRGEGRAEGGGGERDFDAALLFSSLYFVLVQVG